MPMPSEDDLKKAGGFLAGCAAIGLGIILAFSWMWSKIRGK
jgi:hypothetical protein